MGEIWLFLKKYFFWALLFWLGAFQCFNILRLWNILEYLFRHNKHKKRDRTKLRDPLMDPLAALWRVLDGSMGRQGLGYTGWLVNVGHTVSAPKCGSSGLKWALRASEAEPGEHQPQLPYSTHIYYSWICLSCCCHWLSIHFTHICPKSRIGSTKQLRRIISEKKVLYSKEHQQRGQDYLIKVFFSTQKPIALCFQWPWSVKRKDNIYLE